MSPADIVLALLHIVLDAIGAARTREHIDAWEAARVASDAAFVAKFGEKP